MIDLFARAEKRLGTFLLSRILRQVPENPLSALRVAQYEARRLREVAFAVAGMLGEARSLLTDELMGQGVDAEIITHTMTLRARDDDSTIASELEAWESILSRYKPAMENLDG
jgi:hypothetical protein